MVIFLEKLEKAHQISAPSWFARVLKLTRSMISFFLAQERFGQGEFNKRELNSQSYILSKTFGIWCETNM